MTARVLLVGLGQIGCGYDRGLPSDRFVQTHARACTLHPQLELIGAVDPSEAARQACAADYGVPTYATLAAALDAHTPDVVILAAPTAHHPGLLHEVLARVTPRIILCEKPLAASVADARGMVEACDTRGVALYVNYMRCVEPGALEVARRFRARVWAPPYAGVVWYTKGFRHNASHFWTLAERWFGPSRTASVLAREGEWADGDARLLVRAEHDQAVIHYVPVPDGPLSHHAMEVLAGNGRLRYDRGGRAITWEATAPGAAPPALLGDQCEVVTADFDRFQWHVADALVQALSGEPQSLCTGAEAYAGLSRLSLLLES